LAFAAHGVRAVAVRLPQVHSGDGKCGLVNWLLNIAREKGVSSYIGDGGNRWAGAHRLDVARIYRRALEKGLEHGLVEPLGRVVDFCSVDRARFFSILRRAQKGEFGGSACSIFMRALLGRRRRSDKPTEGTTLATLTGYLASNSVGRTCNTHAC
jgi:nucleoside-diphosphate-sugar epimerase